MSEARVRELVNDLERHKRLAVGGDGSVPAFRLGTLDPGRVPFTDAATEVWTWYSERLRHDLQFLTPRGSYQQKATLRAFEKLLDNQRHLNQHADYERTADAKAWRDSLAEDGSVASDQVLLAGLLGELCKALDSLVAIAATVSRDEAGREAWRVHVQRTPESEVRGVLADIGRGLPAARVETIVRRFTGHPRLRNARTPSERLRIAAVVVLEMNLEPLSVPYTEVLDEFGLIGDPLGYALLLMAHATQAAGYSGGRLIPVLRKVWPEIQGDRDGR